MRARVLLIVLIVTWAAGIVRAASHSGIVTFGGLPVPGATVTATRADVTRTTTTDAAGEYRFSDLDEGVWSVQVEMRGFVPTSREVTLGGDDAPATWPLALRPFDDYGRALATTVTKPTVPAAAAPKTATPASRNQTPRGSPPATAPAAPRPAPSAGEEPAGEAAAGASDGLLINGSVNNGAASPFAQMAAFGNNRRGQRSVYNGGLGVLFGSSAWDARPYSFTARQTPKPSYGDVQMLATFGGPIRIPRWFRNGPSSFFGYQHTSDHSATTQSAIVPTLRERNGDFSETRDAQGQPIQIVDPLTGRPFSGNVIPASQLSPQARSLMNYYPLPNVVSGSAFNYQTSLLGVTVQDAMQARLTQAVNGRNQIFGNVSYQRATVDATNLFGFTDTSLATNLDAAINWSHRFVSFLSLRVRYEYTRIGSDMTPFFAGRTNVSGEAGIAGNDQAPENWGPPALTFASGIAGLSTAQFSDTHTSTHTLAAEAFRSVGRHGLTLGASVRPQSVGVFAQQDARGTLGFTGAITHSDLADFLVGVPATSAIAFGNADKALRATLADLYLNDDWRATPTFTVNAGIRWEYESPFTEAQNRLVNLDVADDFSAASPVVAGDEIGATTGRHYSDALLQSDARGIEPRVGIAWRPVAGSSMVVRAGYGIYRNTGVYQTLALLLAQQPPFSKAFSVENSADQPLTLASPFAVTGSDLNTFAIDPAFRVGYAHNWQASLQRDLPASLTVIGTYFGTRGSHLMQEFLPNTYPDGAVNPCSLCPAGFVYLASNGTSLRNAGQIQVRRRLRNGLTATVQYTLAKATDNAAAFVVSASGPQTSGAVGLSGAYIAQNWLDLEAEQAPSNFDQRHLVTAQVQYTTGMGLSGGALSEGLKGSLLAGWTGTAQLTVGSGLPLTPIYITSIEGTGVTGTVRASTTGASLTALPDGYFLNPAAYTAPADGEWGTAARNSVTGPAQFSLNASLGRAFLLRERLNLDCRLDAINVLNQVTYSGVNTTLGSSQFGLPNRANTMRKLQLSARLRF